MKIDDKIVCINNEIYEYDDDLRWTNFKLKKHKIYTVSEIYVSHSELHAEYVSSTTLELEQTHDIYIILNENKYLKFDIFRFVTLQRFRKIKLSKINEKG